MNNKIEQKNMKNRLNFLILCLLLSSILFTGCSSPEYGENQSTPQKIQFPSSPGVPESGTNKTPLSADMKVSNNTMANKWGQYALAQNATAFHQFDSNTSYEFSLGNFTIRNNETQGTEPSYIIAITITAKNTGTDPLELFFQTTSLKDYSGDGRQSRPMSQCGTLILGKIYPGKSVTRTEDITIFSTKGFDYLSSEKFLLEGVIVADSEKTGGTNTKGWLIDLKRKDFDKKNMS